MTRMTKREGGKHVPFVWGLDQQAAFNFYIYPCHPTSKATIRKHWKSFFGISSTLSGDGRSR